MKRVTALFGILLWLLAGHIKAQSGLKGEYYNGTNFEQKVLTRIDPSIHFDWGTHRPASGVDPSYYSIRWTGKLLAPATGQYGFYAKVDDGIRVWVGNQKVMDSWQLNDSKNYSGTITLEGGRYYDLRVDYFNAMLEGEIELYWQRPNAKRTVLNPFSKPSEPITAQYFFQKALPVVGPKPVPVVRTVTNRLEPTIPKPALIRPVTRKPVARPKPGGNTVTKVSVSAPLPTIEPVNIYKPGETVVLPHVQFEQSSYVLLPESSVELDRLVQVMKTNPQWHLDLEGHTDNVGDARLNRALSENRAKVVANYLIRHGIAEDRIETKGYGGSQPIADNTIETERVKNRRVAITIR